MKKIAVALIGGLIVLIGIVLLPLPGPGIVVIIGGLAFLATEFHWARRTCDRMKGWVKRREKAKTAASDPASIKPPLLSSTDSNRPL